MKIKCICGEIIYVYTNYTAQVIPCEDIEDYEKLVTHDFKYSDNYTKSIYQCNDCGRVCIENAKDKSQLVWFYPEKVSKKIPDLIEAETTKNHLMKVIVTPSYDKLSKPNFKVLGSIKGEAWKKKNSHKILKELTPPNKTFSTKEEIFTQSFKQRPAMFTGEHTLKSIRCYIMTYQVALENRNFIDIDDIVFYDFHEYTRKKLGFSPSTAGWANTILAHSLGYNGKRDGWSWEDLINKEVSFEEHKKSIDIFFELLDEFYTEEKKSK